MVLKADVKYLNRSTNDYKDKTYCNVLFMQGAEAVQLGCDRKVYDKMGSLNELQPISCTFEYNAKYERMNLVDFVTAKN